MQPSHFEVLEAHHANGLFARYNFNNKIAVKAQFVRGEVSGSDANFPNSTRERNLSFSSDIKELAFQVEYTLLAFGETKKHWQKSKINYKASTYLFGGICGFRFNPKAYYKGYWYELQPLGTEGQGQPGHDPKYKLNQLGIPIGFGGKFNLTHWSCVGFEIGIRKTFTDYLDDVSGYYPDLAALGETDPMAATLSYRSPELDPEMASANPSGGGRGSIKWKDSFVFAGITAAIRLAK